MTVHHITFVLCRLEWPVRTLSFSHDGKLLASGSEDQTIDIAYVETGEQVAHISVTYPTFTLAWVSYYLLLLTVHSLLQVEVVLARL